MHLFHVTHLQRNTQHYHYHHLCIVIHIIIHQQHVNIVYEFAGKKKHVEKMIKKDMCLTSICTALDAYMHNKCIFVYERALTKLAYITTYCYCMYFIFMMDFSHYVVRVKCNYIRLLLLFDGVSVCACAGADSTTRYFSLKNYIFFNE